MNILVINAGSSSLKYQLINLDTQDVLAKGICEKVGSPDAFHKYGLGDNEIVVEQPMNNHDDAIALVLEGLTSGQNKAIDSLDEIDAIGHRVVQGGKYFSESAYIDDDVIAKIDELAELAPLHNKAALMGINACKTALPGKPMVAVFDSAYFQTLEPKTYMYPIPYEYYEKYGLRKYGAHGTSHRYIAQRAADFLGKDLASLKMITCHLGNGCSMSAINHGVAIDTSMGLTPLDGLMMGTRCGAIDPAVVPFLIEHENITASDANNIMNKKSGLLGISGVSNDMRSVIEACDDGNKRAQLAVEMYAQSIKKYIGAYMAEMGGVDVVVITAGVGENSDKIRSMIFDGLEPLGMILDSEKNKERKGERYISADNSPVKILVIPTNEELMIARDTIDVINNR